MKENGEKFRVSFPPDRQGALEREGIRQKFVVFDLDPPEASASIIRPARSL